MSKCLECGYYNKEKHYCPFYCQLIRETLDEAISFELEKIKEEIIKLPKQGYFISSDGTMMGGYRERSAEDFEVDVLNILNKHISEAQMRDSFKVECSELGMAGCGCFTKEDLMEVGNGFLMQRPKLKEEELCFKCKKYLTDERIAKLKGNINDTDN